MVVVYTKAVSEHLSEEINERHDVNQDSLLPRHQLAELGHIHPNYSFLRSAIPH
jgi:hypothetical protein